MNKIFGRHLLSLGFLLATTLSGHKATHAQVNEWIRHEIAPGLIWSHCHFDSLFGAKQFVNVLDVDLNRFTFKLIHDIKNLKPVSSFAIQSNALAAVNGNFFHTIEGGSVCFIKNEGIITDTTRYDLPPRWFLDQLDDGALVKFGDSADIVLTPPEGWRSNISYTTIISAGPPLLIDGKEMPFVAHSFNTKRYGRTAVGLTPPNHLILLTVEGNRAESAGFTMVELRTMMLQLGCSGALNLDGGSSATMWIGGQSGGTVVSRSASTKRSSQPAERKVANALIVLPRVVN